jgi:hypothetical protein
VLNRGTVLTPSATLSARDRLEGAAITIGRVVPSRSISEATLTVALPVPKTTHCLSVSCVNSSVMTQHLLEGDMG